MTEYEGPNGSIISEPDCACAPATDVVGSYLTGLPVGVEVLDNGELRLTVYAEDLVEAIAEAGAPADHRLRAAEFLALGTALTATHPEPELGVLERLVAAEQAVHAARAALNAAALACREDGRSWAEMGAALGVSRQAAWERFRHVDDPLIRAAVAR